LLSLENALTALKDSDNLISYSSNTADAIHDLEMKKIDTDSRNSDEKSIFIAIRGSKSDGHDFIFDTYKRGTRIFIVENDITPLSRNRDDMIVLTVQSTRLAWSILCSYAYGNPQEKLHLIGVTGTNGKTSVVWMIHQLLSTHNIPSMAIGTLGIFIKSEHYENSHTTPDPDKLFYALHLAVLRGIKYVSMEVSSHSLVQEKIGCIKFSTAIFTSFSRDHLDFHKNLDEYFSSKMRLFKNHVSNEGRFIVSTTLEKRLASFPKNRRRIFYGLTSPELLLEDDLFSAISIQENSLKCTKFNFQLQKHGKVIISSDFEAPYYSQHAIENFTASLLAFYEITRKIPSHDSIKKLTSVPGRLEIVKILDEHPEQPNCIVDYAHTPDALEKTIRILHILSNRKLILVFGCGGNRDKGKRKLMGKIAAEACDHVFITSDNPRTEDPLAIINDIYQGVPENLRSKVILEEDREIAINRSIEMAAQSCPPMNVLIAGKGHETVQLVGDRKLFFSDQIHAREALKRLKLTEYVTEHSVSS